jgi:hypothetical protein
MPDSVNFIQQRFGGSNGTNIFQFGTPGGVSESYEMAATVMYKDGGAGDRPVFAPMQADVLRTRDDLIVTTQLHAFGASGIHGRHILRQAFFALSQKTDGFTFFTLPHSPVAPTPYDWRDTIAARGALLESDEAVMISGDVPATQLVLLDTVDGTPVREVLLVVASRGLVIAVIPRVRAGDQDGPELLLESLDAVRGLLDEVELAPPVLG